MQQKKMSHRTRLAAGSAAAWLALLGAGCGATVRPTTAPRQLVGLMRGRALFRQICAGCHTLADAGSHGFRNSIDTSPFGKAHGEAALAQFVIEHGDSIMPNWKGSLSRKEIETVASYLGAVADRGSTSGDGRRSTVLTPRPHPENQRQPAGYMADGKALFREICAGCHTLADAGAHGERVNLDAALAPVEDKAAVVRRALRASNAMPDWTKRLRPSEIAALVEYISTVAGRGR